MKHHILTYSLSLLIFISSISSAFSQQRVLEVSPTGDKGKTRTFKTGQTMKIKTTTQTDEYSKVRLEKITDSIITFTILDEEESVLLDIKLSDITFIKKPTCLHTTGYVIGSIFMLGGTAVALTAPSIAGYDTASNGEVAAVRVGGLALLALGAVPFIIKPAEYNLKEGWQIKVATK